MEVCEHTLQPNCILLFSIDKAIAEPLIQNHLDPWVLQMCILYVYSK